MKRLLLLVAALCLSSPVAAQVVYSPVQQIQGTNAINRGNPVNVVLTDGSGNAAVLPLPTGAATSALQTTGNTTLSTIATNTTSIATAAKQPALGTAGTPSADVISTQAPTSNVWTYAAAASGISNTTTAVTVKAAGGAGVRTYVTSLQIDFQALGTATEFAIRDGAAGTVLWRMQIPAGVGGMREVNFSSPLRGTANTLLEVVTLTASTTGAVYVNVQGFTGA